MTLARIIARIARGEIEFLIGQFKMASKFFSFDLAYLLNGYFTVINSSTVKPKNLKDAQGGGKLQKKPTHHMTLIKWRQIVHQSIPAAPIPPPGQLRGICTHCQSRGSGISLPKGYPRAFNTHVVSDSKSKRRRFYRKRPVVCH